MSELDEDQLDLKQIFKLSNEDWKDGFTVGMFMGFALSSAVLLILIQIT